jgi:hypothetical protein
MAVVRGKIEDVVEEFQGVGRGKVGVKVTKKVFSVQAVT